MFNMFNIFESKNPNINSKNISNTIKLLAIFLMIVDHIGAAFFPHQIMYRIIGRLAFPLFAYQLTVGFQETTNVNNYLKRLWVFALISQIPYTLLFDTTRFNIFFTLFVSLFLLKKIEEADYSWVFSGLIVAELIDLDYGAYGILLVIMFYLLSKSEVVSCFLILSLNVFFIGIGHMSQIQAYSVLSLAIVFMSRYNLLPKLTINRKLMYWIYPLHLTVFLLLKLFLLS